MTTFKSTVVVNIDNFVRICQHIFILQLPNTDMEFKRGIAHANLVLAYLPVKKRRCPNIIFRSAEKIKKSVGELEELGKLFHIQVDSHSRFSRQIGKCSQLDVCANSKSQETGVAAEFFVTYKFYPPRSRIMQNLRVFTELLPSMAHEIISDEQKAYRAFLDPRLSALSLIEAAEEIEQLFLGSTFTHALFEEIKNAKEELNGLLRLRSEHWGNYADQTHLTTAECAGIVCSYFEIILLNDFGNFFNVVADRVY